MPLHARLEFLLWIARREHVGVSELPTHRTNLDTGKKIMAIQDNDFAVK